MSPNLRGDILEAYPGSLLSLTVSALNRSRYFSTLRDPAFATTHLPTVSPGCPLNRGKFGVRVERLVRPGSSRTLAWFSKATARNDRNAPARERNSPPSEFRRDLRTERSSSQ